MQQTFWNVWLQSENWLSLYTIINLSRSGVSGIKAEIEFAPGGSGLYFSPTMGRMYGWLMLTIRWLTNGSRLVHLKLLSIEFPDGDVPWYFLCENGGIFPPTYSIQVSDIALHIGKLLTDCPADFFRAAFPAFSQGQVVFPLPSCGGCAATRDDKHRSIGQSCVPVFLCLIPREKSCGYGCWTAHRSRRLSWFRHSAFLPAFPGNCRRHTLLHHHVRRHCFLREQTYPARMPDVPGPGWL